MNRKIIESIVNESNKQWYLTQSEVARLIGRTRQFTATFLAEKSVPYHRLGANKSYFLPDVIEAIEKTRWQEPVYK